MLATYFGILALLFLIFGPQRLAEWMQRRKELARAREIAQTWLEPGEKVVGITKPKNGECIAFTTTDHRYRDAFYVWLWFGICRRAGSFHHPKEPWYIISPISRAFADTPVRSIRFVFLCDEDGMIEAVTDDGMYEANYLEGWARKKSQRE
jgi:hypothetical protein